MRKRGITIAAVTIASVFVLTVAAFAVSVYSDYQAGAESASSRFEKLSSHTAETSGIYPCGSKEFIDAFNSAITIPSVFEQLRLEVDDIEVYSYPSIPTDTTSIFVKSFSTRIVGGDGAKIQLTANIYALSPSMIFYRAKIAFIIILTGTLATCILLMYVYLSESESKSEEPQNKYDESLGEDFEEPALDYNDIDMPEEENIESNVNTEVAETDPETIEEATIEEATETSIDGDVEYTEAVVQEHTVPAMEQPQTTPVQTVQATQPQEENDSGEQGLFSQASGFGWESYINERLESELVRAASSEQDLSLLMMQIPGMTKESEQYKEICQKILDAFQFKDMIFEYKEDGFAIIVQNSDIDHAMENAEKLYTEILSLAKKASADSKPVMGISSRSLRLISVDRLRTEAEQALIHASEDADSPIVAFRVNPEKYRQYIQQN